MLTIRIPDRELFNDETSEFFVVKGQVLKLEHSLVSLSKWESKWLKPFLTTENKTEEESIDYIRMMTITQNVNPNVYSNINSEVIDQVSNYIAHPMTATTFAENRRHVINREVITAEIIYYWMIALNIPFECQKWHLNRLLTLINVCNIKNQPKKKMRRSEIYARNHALNEARKAQLNTRG
jgi:hypothetical protein